MAGPGDYIDLGPIGAGALWGATKLPGIPGAIATAAQLGARAYNTYNSGQIRAGLGLPDQSIGQWLGGILGLNDRGSLAGNNVIANRDEFSNPYNGTHAAVTTGGLYDNGGFFGRMLAGLLGDYADLRTSYTPEEARLRQIAAAAYAQHQAAAAAAAGHPIMSPTTATPRVVDPWRDPALGMGDHGGNGLGSTSNGGGGGNAGGKAAGGAPGGLASTAGGRTEPGRSPAY